MERGVFSYFFWAIALTACSQLPAANSSNISSATPSASLKNVETKNPVRTLALVVQYLGNPFFNIANLGAQEAAKELGATVIYTGPETRDATLQIQLINSLVAQKVDGLAISANDADALVPVGKNAMAAGIPVVSWGFDIAEEGRILHIGQVDGEVLGEIQIKMASEITGPDGGEIAIIRIGYGGSGQDAELKAMQELLTHPEYAKLHLVNVVLFREEDDIRVYNETQGLIDEYPNLKVIICTNPFVIGAAARAVTDRGLIGKVFVTGLGTPKAMREFVKSGAAPMFALWSPADLGYLTIYTLNALAVKQITGKEGDTYSAGRLGEFTVKVDLLWGPNILLGFPFVWNKDNIDEPYSQF